MLCGTGNRRKIKCDVQAMCQIPQAVGPFGSRELTSLDWKQHEGLQQGPHALLTVVSSNRRHLVASGPLQSLACRVPTAPSLPFWNPENIVCVAAVLR